MYRHAVGRIDFINDRWSELLGTDASVLPGTGWMRFVHSDDLGAITQSQRVHARTGQPYFGQWRFKRSNAAYRWVEIRAEPQWDDGRIVRWFGAGTHMDLSGARSTRSTCSPRASPMPPRQATST